MSRMLGHYATLVFEGFSSAPPVPTCTKEQMVCCTSMTLSPSISMFLRLLGVTKPPGNGTYGSVIVEELDFLCNWIELQILPFAISIEKDPNKK